MGRFRRQFSCWAAFAFVNLGTIIFILPSCQGEVVELTESNFDSLVMKEGVVWVVEYYTTWCHHCMRRKKDYVQVCTHLEDIGVKCGVVNADENFELVERFGVEYLPTFMILGSKKHSPKYFGGHTSMTELIKVAVMEANEHLSYSKDTKVLLT